MKLCILWMLFPARDGPMICTYLYMFCSSIQTGNPTISLESVRGPGDQKNKNKIRGTSPPWTHPPVIDALTNNHLFISFLTPKPPRLAFSKWAKECGCWNVFFLSINYGHSLQRNATASWCWQKLWNLGDAHPRRYGMIFQEIPLFAFSHEKTHFKIHRVSSSISCCFNPSDGYAPQTGGHHARDFTCLILFEWNHGSPTCWDTPRAPLK